MSKMSMPFRGRTITTTVSGGGEGWVAAVLLAAAAAFVVWLAVQVQRAIAPHLDLIETVLTGVVVAPLVIGAVFVGVAVLPDVVTLPRDRRRAAEFAEHAAEVRAEIEARAEAAQEAAEALDHEPVFGPGHGLDGARDGKLIDAAGRFRSLGSFLPADDDIVIDHKATGVVEWSTDVDQALGDLDQLRAERDRRAR